MSDNETPDVIYLAPFTAENKIRSDIIVAKCIGNIEAEGPVVVVDISLFLIA